MLRLTPPILVFTIRRQILCAGSHFHLLSPGCSLLTDDTRAIVNAAVVARGPFAAFFGLFRVGILPLLTIPLSVDQQVIQPETQQGELVVFEILGVVGAQIDGGGNAADDGDLMGVDQGPAGGEAGGVLGLEEHQPGNYHDVVSEAVAELVPPISADDFGLVDFMVGP